jgi:tetratricopeptide (TPR) repeat protein
LLGDIEQDPEHWHKAIDAAGGRFARAHRSLGRYLYKMGEFQGAKLAYAASLEINPLNFSAWFAYGCCAIDLGDWELAAEAFRRCIAIDSDDGESWSNLATAYLKMTPKRQLDAHRALSQALSSKYDNWKIWENYAIVSAAIGEC